MKTKSLLQKVLIIGLAIVGILLLLLLINPHVFLIVINVIWMLVFVVTLLFVLVGVLTFIGRKDEASRIIDLFVEGSITFIDIAKFFKDLWSTFKQILVETAAILIPKMSYGVAVVIYLAIISFYKLIGIYVDVTIPTIILTFVITALAAIITLPRFQASMELEKGKLGNAFDEFKNKLIDSFEVVIFILFLTIDATYLFFLPKNLNVPIHAEIGNYDLMIRSIASSDHLLLTINLIIIGVALELIRKIFKLTVIGTKYYKNPNLISENYEPMGSADLLKRTIRKTMAESKEEFLSFAAFTVFITFVFLFFPRLKLLALIAASFTGLVFDILFTERFTTQGRDDLLARLFRRISRS